MIKVRHKGMTIFVDEQSGAVIGVTATDKVTQADAVKCCNKVLDWGIETGLPYIWAKGDTATFLKLAIETGRGIRIYTTDKREMDKELLIETHGHMARGVFSKPCTNPARDRFRKFFAVWPLDDSGRLPWDGK